MTIRLALTVASGTGGAMSAENLERALGPSVHRAWAIHPSVAKAVMHKKLPTEHSHVPALLVSYYYLESFLKNRERFVFRDWVMDSGAFSAKQSGVEIDLTRYIGKCRELMESDELLSEVYALDVIGDHIASRRNAEKMWEHGVPAIPCYHHGEPVTVLTELASEYPKIALGGAVGLKGDYKIKWAEQCFARVWPKKIHGFGFGSEKQIMSLPWHSVDATNWELGPCKFGNWKHYGKMSVRGSKQNLRSEVEWYLKLEERARVKWRKQMRQLEDEPGVTLRLAIDAGSGSGERATGAFSRRLAAQQGSEAQIKKSGLK